MKRYSMVWPSDVIFALIRLELWLEDQTEMQEDEEDLPPVKHSITVRLPND